MTSKAERDIGAQVRAITPKEAAAAKESLFPPEAFQAFNNLITEKLINGRACFTQREVVQHMVDRGLIREQIFERGWLNVEEAYGQTGWEVIYDKPGFNETYEAIFTFIKDNFS